MTTKLFKLNDEILNNFIDSFYYDFKLDDVLSTFSNYKIDKKDTNLSIEVKVPGFDSSTIDLELDFTPITVLSVYTIGEKRNEYVTIPIPNPENYSLSEIDANIKNGLLKITVPCKKPQKEEPIKIKVK